MHLLSSDTLVIDVGANIGIMTALLAKKYPNIEIHSFEPIPENFNVLTRICNKLLIRNARLYPIALGNKAGSLQMIMPILGDARQQGLSHVVVDPSEAGHTYEVAVSTLDTIFKENKRKIGGIKLDVENFEYYVLEGARQILAQHHPIVYVELWDNENRTNCIRLLSEYNYKAYLFNGSTLELFTNQLGHNFFFLVD
jgi:FkbM family methyltransferase